MSSPRMNYESFICKVYNCGRYGHEAADADLYTENDFYIVKVNVLKAIDFLKEKHQFKNQGLVDEIDLISKDVLSTNTILDLEKQINKLNSLNF